LKLSIIIPTYNEAENLPKITSALFDLGIPDLSILVVDDNSPDGTGKIAEDLGRRSSGRITVLHRPGKQGLGSAYIQGFNQAISDGAEVLGQMDADFSHPPEKLRDLLTALETFDISIGSRYVLGGKVDEHWPLWRKSLSGFGNYYARTILNLPLRDVTGGFRLWRRNTILGMPLHTIRSNGYNFQVEMIYVAIRLGFKVKEIPIYFADRRWGKSKMSLQIQAEAALRVWQVLWLYRGLK
jgi:dolichol-phosphate mannosyltransferase